MHLNLFQITSKIVALSRSGRLTCARKLFDEMPHRDLVAWNAMITSYSHLGLHREALSIFYNMRITNTKPDHFSFTAALNACAGIGELRSGAKIHGLVTVSGFQSSLPVNNSLIDMYGKCLDPCSASEVFKYMEVANEITWCSLLFVHVNNGFFISAYEVFHTMPRRGTVAWNIMISCHARCGEIGQCLDLFRGMQNSNCSPDHCTFSSLMHACAESFEFLYGCVVHAFIVKTGWNVAVEVKNSILSFYAKLGCQTEAMEEIESIGTLTQVSWNAIIDAHMKMGDIHEAFNVFQKAPDKNVVSWTSMIAGYARSGAAEQALTFFVDMIKSGVLPDDFTFGAALYACSSLAVLGLGRMVHACVVQNGFLVHAYVGNGLINMYAKCGDIEGSSWAFHDILDKDLVSWNAMLFGFGMHGLTTQALQLYEDVVASGVKPDRVTFIGLLMTCSHSGLIEKGKAFFKLMETVYKLPHEADHVACMVDMLGRGGYLAEAKELTKRYSLAGNARATSCEVLLGACSAHGDVKTGTYIGEDLKILEPDREMSYVLLSNLYCASEQWKEAEMIRKSMVDQGIKKMPGCSWIELRNKVTTFVAGNTSHIYTEELSNILCCLDFQIRNQCYSGFKK